MQKDSTSVWGEMLLSDPLVHKLQRDFNAHAAWLAEQPMAPPLPWWKRRVNRARYWFSENVAWRFARHQPDNDW